MTNDQRFEDLRARLVEARQEHEKLKARIRKAPKRVAPGDLFRFELPFDTPLEWAVVHPGEDEESRWFVVPADQNSLAGTRDVVVPSSAECGPLTLRCGRGLWIGSKDFDFQQRSGFLEPRYVDEARSKLSEIRAGSIAGTEEQHEIDEDVDYEDWLDEVGQAVDWLDRRLNTPVNPSVRLQFKDFSKDWILSISGRLKTKRPPKSSGCSLVPKAVKDFPPEPLPGHVVSADLAGSLASLFASGSVFFVYFSLSGEQPPVVKWADSRGHCIEGTWRPTPLGNWRCLEHVPLRDDVVEVELDTSDRRLAPAESSKPRETRRFEYPRDRAVTDGDIRTNPVWSFRRLAHGVWDERNPLASQETLGSLLRHWKAEQISLPAGAVRQLVKDQWVPPDAVVDQEEPGCRVVALGAVAESRTGLAVPLEAKPSSRWHISRSLSVRAHDVKKALTRLIRSSAVKCNDRALPRFHIDENLRREIEASAVIPAALAVIDELNGRSSELLRRACAVVEPADESSLRSVASITEKLEAFVREYEEGSLLVRHSRSADAAEFDEFFEYIWAVDTYADLARHLQEAGLLQALLRPQVSES